MEKVRGSRFIAWAGPVGSVDEVRERLALARRRWPDATHHCFAWRLKGGDFRYSDNGEPSGSAGRPILDRIGGLDLVDVLVVVIRYFGGTKLGKGGLVRAYGSAAAAVLEGSRVLEVLQRTAFELTYDYSDSGAVDGLLHGGAAQVVSRSFGARVQVRVEVLVEEASEFRRQLGELASGRVEVRMCD